MTSETSRIQLLIKEIDEVLSKTTPRLPWVMSSDAAQQRQVLEQTRNYLLSSLSALQESTQQAKSQTTDTAEAEQPSNNQGVVATVSSAFPSANAMEASAQQVLQSVLQEMTYLRTNMLQPMRSDVDALRQQRDALMQEVRQLEAQRQQYQLSHDPQYITEFLQAAMAKVQENLSSQVSQMLGTFVAQSPNDQARLGAAPSGLGLPSSADLSTLSPTERLAYMQRIQAQSDQLMMRLDSTLRVVFESLQSNVNSYRDSLGEGLNRMHDMGQQGEAVFGAFVTRLAQIMGREASSFLQQQSSDWGGDRPSLPGNGLAVETDPDFQIDRLLEELNAFDPSAPHVSATHQPGTDQPGAGVSLPFDHNMAAPESLPLDMELENLELLDRELSQLDLNAVTTEVDLPADAVTFLPNEPFSFPIFEESDNSANTTLNIEPSRVDRDVAEEELESALDLLNQITPDAEETSVNELNEAAETPLVGQPEQLYEDEFYHSLFGQPPIDLMSSEATQNPEPASSESAPSETEAEPPALTDPHQAATDANLENLLLEDLGFENLNADQSNLEASNSGDWSADLFGGLADPALEVSPAPEIPIFDLTSNLSQSVENLLFQTPEPPAPNLEETFDSFFVGEEEPVAATGATGADREEVETITSLLELIPPADREPEPKIIQPLSTIEESYELAQPEEDLLALDKMQSSTMLPNLQIPDDTLQQLTVDLANLETTNPTDTPAAGWTLAELDAALASEPQTRSASEPATPELTIEDLLFADDLSGVSPNEASDNASLRDVALEPDSTPETSDSLNFETANFETANDLMESTIEDWFAAVESDPVVTPEANQESDLFDWEGNPSTTEADVEENTFTLEGLGSLFEGVPSIDSASTADQVSASESPAITVDDVFGEFGSDPAPSSDESESKKKRLTLEEIQAEIQAETQTEIQSDVSKPDLRNADPAPSNTYANTAEDITRETENRAISTASLADLIQDLLFPPSETTEASDQQQGWYLGLDFGTTGISAVLLNLTNRQLHPIYWFKAQPTLNLNDLLREGFGDRRFRLPTVTDLIATDEPLASTNTAREGDRSFHDRSSHENIGQSNWRLSFPVIAAQQGVHSTLTDVSADASTLAIQDFKPYLNTGIPYYSTATNQWQPMLQWSESRQIPLIWLQHILQTALATLHRPNSGFADSTTTSQLVTPQFTCGAMGLEEEEFWTVMRQLTGVVVGSPANWSDTYNFNVREAILAAGLVAQPDQVLFLEDTIATLLSVLRREQLSAHLTAPNRAYEDVVAPDADWQGNTLILSAGTSVTELAIVNLPAQLRELSHADFQIRTIAYAGSSLDQDIICQILYPLLQQPVMEYALGGDEPADLSLEPVDAERLQLEVLTLPKPGELDLMYRHRLQQRLESARSGQILLEAARCLKLALQQQSRFTLKLGDRQWTILRQDLGSKVILPYVQRLNRELNSLLKQTDTSVSSVSQVICTGGTASMAAIARWLRQKFANATIIQDTYARPVTAQDHCIASCSQVAYGLAVLPLYPQLFDLTRHQYSDYFLLMELLRCFPDHPVSADELLQILADRGVNVADCRSHILALLEGHLPPGLVPAHPETSIFTEASLQQPEVQAIQTHALFYRQGNQYYPDQNQRQHLQHYLNLLLANTQQTLTTAYTAIPSLSLHDCG